MTGGGQRSCPPKLVDLSYDFLGEGTGDWGLRLTGRGARCLLVKLAFESGEDFSNMKKLGFELG